MKIIVGTDVGDYTFAPGAPGVGAVTFTGLPTLTKLEQIALVANVTRGVLLFNFASASARGHLGGSVLTLDDVDTSTMAAGDRLSIVVDVPVGAAPSAPVVDANAAAILAAIQTLAEGMQYYLSAMLDKMPRLDAADRAAVTINDAGATVALATTQDLRNLTGYLAQLGATGRLADLLPFHASQAASALIYDRIIVS